MAITKIIGAIHPAKKGSKYRSLQHTIEYILNPKKTAGGFYTGSLNCMLEHSLDDMIRTMKFFGKEPRKQNDRIGYHLTISWNPDEKVSEEMALEVAKEFCETYLYGYECVYAVHNDQNHMHVHVCFSSVSCFTGMKYRYEDKDWENKIQPIVDELCARHGLRTLEEDTKISLDEYKSDRRKKRKKHTTESHSNTKYDKESYTWNDYIRFDLDQLVAICSDMESFETKLKEMGYEIKHGKSERYGSYMAVRAPGMDRYRRTYILGKDYTEAALLERMQLKNKPLPELPHDPMMCYTFSRRRYRIKIQYRTTNVYIRRQYYRMYQLGIVPRYSHISYQEKSRRWKELKKLEYQLDMINQYQIQSTEQIELFLQNKEQELMKKKVEIKKLKGKVRYYLAMLNDVQKLEELSGAYQLFQDGDMVFKEEAEHYLRLKERVEAYPFSKKELEQFKQEYQDIQKVKKKELAEIKRQKNAWSELFKEYQEEQQHQEITEEQLEDIDGFLDRSESIQGHVLEQIKL